MIIKIVIEIFKDFCENPLLVLDAFILTFVYFGFVYSMLPKNKNEEND